MDQVMDLVRTDAIDIINNAIDDAKVIEKWIVDLREKYGPQLHPWAMPSLTNAIGSIQHAIGDLKHAKHHIETPEPTLVGRFITKYKMDVQGKELLVTLNGARERTLTQGSTFVEFMYDGKMTLQRKTSPSLASAVFSAVVSCLLDYSGRYGADKFMFTADSPHAAMYDKLLPRLANKYSFRWYSGDSDTKDSAGGNYTDYKLLLPGAIDEAMDVSELPADSVNIQKMRGSTRGKYSFDVNGHDLKIGLATYGKTSPADLIFSVDGSVDLSGFRHSLAFKVMSKVVSAVMDFHKKTGQRVFRFHADRAHEAKYDGLLKLAANKFNLKWSKEADPEAEGSIYSMELEGEEVTEVSLGGAKLTPKGTAFGSTYDGEVDGLPIQVTVGADGEVIFKYNDTYEIQGDLSTGTAIKVLSFVVSALEEYQSRTKLTKFLLTADKEHVSIYRKLLPRLASKLGWTSQEDVIDSSLSYFELTKNKQSVEEVLDVSKSAEPTIGDFGSFDSYDYDYTIGGDYLEVMISHHGEDENTVLFKVNGRMAILKNRHDLAFKVMSKVISSVFDFKAKTGEDVYSFDADRDHEQAYDGLLELFSKRCDLTVSKADLPGTKPYTRYTIKLGDNKMKEASRKYTMDRIKTARVSAETDQSVIDGVQSVRRIDDDDVESLGLIDAAELVYEVIDGEMAEGVFYIAIDPESDTLTAYPIATDGLINVIDQSIISTRLGLPPQLDDAPIEVEEIADNTLDLLVGSDFAALIKLDIAELEAGTEEGVTTDHKFSNDDDESIDQPIGIEPTGLNVLYRAKGNEDELAMVAKAKKGTISKVDGYVIMSVPKSVTIESILVDTPSVTYIEMIDDEDMLAPTPGTVSDDPSTTQDIYIHTDSTPQLLLDAISQNPNIIYAYPDILEGCESNGLKVGVQGVSKAEALDKLSSIVASSGYSNYVIGYS
jgi:hypothetical protein